MKQRAKTTLMFVKQILSPAWGMVFWGSGSGAPIRSCPSGYVTHVFAAFAKPQTTMKGLYVTII